MRDLVISKLCRADNYLSNDIKYVRIGQILRGYSSNFTAKNILLTFQMEPKGTFWENSKYDHWILHKKLVLDETITIIHILTHIS